METLEQGVKVCSKLTIKIEIFKNAQLFIEYTLLFYIPLVFAALCNLQLFHLLVE